MLAAGARSRTAAPLARLADLAAVAPGERVLAGYVSGGFYAVGGVTLALLIALPGVSRHQLTLLALAVIACGWGARSLLLIDWRRAPGSLIHVSTAGALAVIAAAVASSGGASSPAWIYLFFVPVFSAYFFPPPAAVGYCAATAATNALVLLYDPQARHDPFVAQLGIATVAFFAIGSAIIVVKGVLGTLRVRAERRAAEEGALRRLATAVVEGEPAERIYELAAREAASLLGADAAAILRLDAHRRATVMGSWANHEGRRPLPGSTVQVEPGGDARARETNMPVRVDAHRPGGAATRLGYASGIVVPISIGGVAWGVLSVTAAESVHLTSRDEQELMDIGQLLATAIVSLEDRARLSAQASTDPLTGVANHRALQERLGAELSRALRHQAPVTVALIDIDNFKHVNDYGGHEAGDAVLVRVARCLADHARAEDTLGRLGGDEFAWVMPETTREQALVAVERARRLIAATASREYRITVSAGICDTKSARHSAELISFADAALYWSKAHGRNRCWLYDPGAITELSAHERIERVERASALVGLHALARAIDARDPAMGSHSDRVADLVSKMARAAGWPAERVVLLSEAALVHDVGKVGIRRELLHKDDPLTSAEREQMMEHAELAARIAEGVLTAEQVEWIRDHHERPDGRGYPRGLTEPDITDGAAFLAVADAWDAMTSGRPYQEAKGVDASVAECTRLVGSQFTRAAVGALLKLHASGELDAPDAGPRRDAVSPSSD